MDPKCIDINPTAIQAQTVSLNADPPKTEEIDKDKDGSTILKAELIVPHGLDLHPPPVLGLPLRSEDVPEASKKIEQGKNKPSQFTLIPVRMSRNKAGDSEQPQSDSADEHRQDLPETLQRIFANAQRTASKEPQMEEHRLERFSLASFDEDQHEYGEDEEYIEDETLNVLCSPLLCNSQELCIPPPAHRPSQQQEEGEVELERRESQQSGQRRVVGQCESDVCKGG